jgi:hypothetical protein
VGLTGPPTAHSCLRFPTTHIRTCLLFFYLYLVELLKLQPIFANDAGPLEPRMVNLIRSLVGTNNNDRVDDIQMTGW